MKVTKLFLLSTLSAAFSFAGTIIYDANLNGPSESPPNASPATGFAIVTFDDIANTMRVQVNFSGLLGTTTASHIHCCTALPFTGTANVATQTPSFAGFPLGVTSGSYDHTFDMTLTSTYNAPFVTASGGTAAGAEAALIANAAAGLEYLNVHSTVDPGGEIRGFLVAVPEPGTWVLAIAGLGLTWAAKRKLA